MNFRIKWAFSLLLDYFELFTRYSHAHAILHYMYRKTAITMWRNVIESEIDITPATKVHHSNEWKLPWRIKETIAMRMYGLYFLSNTINQDFLLKYLL